MLLVWTDSNVIAQQTFVTEESIFLLTFPALLSLGITMQLFYPRGWRYWVESQCFSRSQAN